MKGKCPSCSVAIQDFVILDSTVQKPKVLPPSAFDLYVRPVQEKPVHQVQIEPEEILDISLDQEILVEEPDCPHCASSRALQSKNCLICYKQFSIHPV
jgi:hypothetical protein